LISNYEKSSSSKKSSQVSSWFDPIASPLQILRVARRFKKRLLFLEAAQFSTIFLITVALIYLSKSNLLFLTISEIVSETIKLF